MNEQIEIPGKWKAVAKSAHDQLEIMVDADDANLAAEAVRWRLEGWDGWKVESVEPLALEVQS